MLKKSFAKINYWSKLLVMFGYNVVCFFATINAFRGYWYFYDYYLPGNFGECVYSLK